jgi:putative SOS response-associated peptidase YedK
MCGRYASARKRIELLEEFSVQRDRVTEPLAPDYNVAPTKPVYAVLTREGRDDTAGDGGAGAGPGDSAQPHQGRSTARELRVVRWGLVPSWAKDVSIGSRLINARAETLSEKPAYRRAFAKRRCLLPADGYYEWQVLPPAPGTEAASGKAPKTVKQPYFIHRADGGPLAFAGLYELWRDRAVPDGDPEAWLWSATIVTTSAPDELGRIHDRMPMVIAPESWADWLDPANNDTSDLQALLTPAVADVLESYPVSTAVNAVRHNGPDLIDRVPAEGLVSLAAQLPLPDSGRGKLPDPGSRKPPDPGSNEPPEPRDLARSGPGPGSAGRRQPGQRAGRHGPGDASAALF